MSLVLRNNYKRVKRETNSLIPAFSFQPVVEGVIRNDHLFMGSIPLFIWGGGGFKMHFLNIGGGSKFVWFFQFFK